MRPISKKVLEKIKSSKKIDTCVWCGSKNNIELHHAFIYSGKQIDEDFAIHPLCSNCHRGYNGTIRKEIKDYCELLSLGTGIKILTQKYTKVDWNSKKKYLENLIKKFI